MSRVNPLENLDKFEPKPAADKPPKPSREEVAKIAKANGFPSRQAPAPKETQERPHQTYFRTGRNKQINIKGTPECDAHLARLHAEMGLPKGVILQEALNALETVKDIVLERYQRTK